jgi:Zn-dependent protease
MMLLALPVTVMALSAHESAHGYAAYRLGDPTARSLGRITLNPVKHFDLFGFLSMLVFHIGWAKPVPINARHFKKPRRDMAITGAAGPLSNIALALIHLIVLRLFMIFVVNAYKAEALSFIVANSTNQAFTGTFGFTVVALVVYLLYMGVAMNVVLAVFNLIPIPPFDGSRIFYVFLPPKLYWGVMKYERYIMLGCIVLLFLMMQFNFNPLGAFENWVIRGLFTATGMGNGSDALGVFNTLLVYLEELLYV